MPYNITMHTQIVPLLFHELLCTYSDHAALIYIKGGQVSCGLKFVQPIIFILSKSLVLTVSFNR